MWYELILLITGMTRLFCPISRYQRGLKLNNKIYCLLFISNLILAGFWAFCQPVSFIWMTLNQCKEQKIFENVLSPLQNQAPGAAQAVSPVLFSSLALAAHSWDHRIEKVTSICIYIQQQGALRNKHKSFSFINAKGRSKTACKFSAVSSCFLIWFAPLSPSNLLLSLCLHPGVQSLVRSLKATHLSNKCFLIKSKK